ncbi:MAG: M23 family metallopeptidase [Dehalococcoidia bacterium]|nr:MAG: M23 family metallopeptidase [Dehalococcoidia bacterium]
MDDSILFRPLSRRMFLVRGAFGAGGLLLLACGGDEKLAPAATTAAATKEPEATPQPSVTPTPTPVPPVIVTGAVALPPGPVGFIYPIAGACMPQGDQLMPNAPRTYRNGFHEGLDFYPGLACAEVKRGTVVVATAAGTVIRADLDYKDITLQQITELDAKTKAQGSSDPVTLDIYRGRQVWVDHGGGVVTRYCHLNSIDPAIKVGVTVKAGTVLAGVGESGTPEWITAPNTELHLHFEVRVGDSFLGSGLPPPTVRALYGRLFAPR